MPEHANIFYTEDNRMLASEYFHLFSMFGHTVYHASTLEGALELIQHFEELNLDVAVLDANLASADISNTDGALIIAAIREKSSILPIIGLTGSKEFEGTSVVFSKDEIDTPGKLLTYIEQL